MSRKRKGKGKREKGKGRRKKKEKKKKGREKQLNLVDGACGPVRIFFSNPDNRDGMDWYV